MKAYIVYDIDDMFSTIVFADTSGKAKARALRTDTCEDSEFTRIRTKRVPQADCLYNGSWEIDWDDQSQRLFLVKEMGWACYEPYPDECIDCVAKQYCHWQQDENNLIQEGFEI